MFHDRPLARVLLIVASALGLSFTQSAAAFPEETIDPGVPPSEAPDHSGELFNFGSTFIFSFSQSVGTFVPGAVVNCTTCKFPVLSNSVHTFSLTGRVLGQVRGNDGQIIASSAGVYDMNITITGVRATASAPVDVGDGLSEQTITYRANLLDGAVVSGTLVLDTNVGTSPQPDPLPAGDEEGSRIIRVGARAGATPTFGLITDPGPAQTFPAIPASSPRALGQDVAANVVFQVTETKRGRFTD